MKKFFLMALITFASVSVQAELPLPKAFVITDAKKIEEILSNKHLELQDPYCIRNGVLYSPYFQSAIASGRYVKKAFISFGHYDDGSLYLLARFDDQNGDSMSGAVCNLK
ncbi:MAG: hypothetical protein ACOYL6_19365 [Bacteriovoracaceae bacterium]